MKLLNKLIKLRRILKFQKLETILVYGGSLLNQKLRNNQKEFQRLELILVYGGFLINQN
eukprot:jgi/Orpsp1_1/1174663/evm.model.c7180000050897.1